MWFITIVLKNLLRRPLRSSLTIVAIAIAIGAVVSLVGVADGFERSYLQLYEEAGIDLIVVRAGARQRLNSALGETLGDKIKALPGVKDVVPGLVDVVSFEQYGVYSVLLQGLVPETEVFRHLHITEGRNLTRTDTRAVILGTVVAKNMGKSVGDTIEIIEHENFKVVGIYQSANVFENGSLVLPLKELQRLMDRPGQVTGFNIILTGKQESNLREMRTEIERLEKNITALPAREHVSTLSEIQMAKGMAWITSTIALLIGFFGMVNTMIMSVHERTREIGILRAVGWRRGRVVKMILMEAVLLSILGAMVGIVGAVALVQLLTRLPTVSSFVEGSISPALMFYAQALAIGVGLLGGALPAFRAAHMLPTAALRYE